MDELLRGSTGAQEAAIRHVEGPLLVLAGPGSGKTRVVTHRVAYLLEQGVPPENILAITFTNKAAGEMRERVTDLVDIEGLWISTFHAMGARMLRRYAARAGLDPSYTIYDGTDQVRVIRGVLRSLDLDATQLRPAAISSAIGRLKTDLIPPGKAAGRARDYFEKAVATVYPIYERRLAESNAVDFDDLLLKPLELLRSSATVREHYQKRFRFLLVDEYQDTNRAQFLTLKMLTAPENNLHVTGDPDQSIYRFRGADIRNILEFEAQYPDSRVVRLEKNFRSTPFILAGADSLIRNNRDRKPKRLIPTRSGGKKIRLHEAGDEEEEGRLVADGVLAALEKGVPYAEMAVFYRIHALSRSLERSFFDRNIPYTIVRGTEFFRRAEVLDLLAYLKVLANPRDSESLLRVLNIPVRGIGRASQDRLAGFANERGIPLLAAVHRSTEAKEIRGRARDGLANLSLLFRRLAEQAEGPLAALLGDLIREVDYAAHLKKRYPDDHEDRWENVAQLVASTAEHQEKNPTHGLLDYLQEVSLLSDVDGADPRSERVPFMTLHTAKGLEFEVVFIVGLEGGLLPHSRSLDSPRDLEEERRLLFVGMTRAKEELHLSHARNRFRWGQHGASVRSRFLDEIDPESLEEEEEEEEAAAGLHYEVDEWVEPGHAVTVSPGMLVKHQRFGTGRVKALSGSGAAAKVTVAFADHGTKRLLLMYANLTLVEETPW